MNNSVYLNQMNEYRERIRQLERKKQKYLDLDSKISTYQNDIETIRENLNKSKESFLNGGFALGENTFDDGVIEDSSSQLNELKDKYDSIHSTIFNKIAKIDIEINKNRNLYNIAQYEYQREVIS